MASNATITSDAGWQDYKPDDEGWQDYKPKVSAQASTAPQQSGVMGTLGREASSFGSTLAGIPGSIYHAFSDDPTQEETQEAGGPQEVSGAKRVGLGIGRLTAQPLINAVRWYGDAAQGKIPNAYEQALSVAPEAMGAGGAGVVAGKMAEVAPGAVKTAVTEGVPPVVRAGATLANKALTPRTIGTAAGGAIGGPFGAVAGGELGSQFGSDPIFRVPGENFGLGTPLISKVRLGPEPEPPIFSKVRLGPDPAPPGPPPVFSKTRLGPDPAPTPNPVFSPVPLGPDAPPSDFLAFNKIRASGMRPGGLRQAVSSRPLPRDSDALGQIPQPKLVDQIMQRTTADEPFPRSVSSQASGEVEAPQTRLIDRVHGGAEGQEEVGPPPTKLIDQVLAPPRITPALTRPVTENPVVGSLVRAMQKSGVPIAERPNLLLKGSGRVNRGAANPCPGANPSPST
jgi:hypothetical protein